MEYIILILSLAGIVFGANFLVNGSVIIARKFKVSDFVIGAVIVGVGTSTPELVVSFLGALKGNADVAIGNVVGSNIFNVLGILGLTAVLFPIAVDRCNMKFEIPLCVIVSIVLAVLVYNFFNGQPPEISRPDGIVLLALFAFFMWYSFYRDKNIDVPAADENLPHDGSPLWLAIIMVAGGLAALVTGCDLFVDNAVSLARSNGVNDAFISLTLIACGTSLPELAASMAAAIKKNTQMALGNIIGSNIFNITLILGLCAQVRPLTSSDITGTDYIVMIAAAVIPMIFGFSGRIGRLGGAVMFLSYVAYSWYLVNTQMS